MPDVVEVPENKEKKPLNKKQVMKLVTVGAVLLLIILGVAVSVLEKIRANRSGKNSLESLSERAKLIERKPGRMSWLFYLDKDEDSLFDYEEDVFKAISVSLRKPGETQVLRTVPANVLGQVIIDDLTNGEYEISFDNYSKNGTNEGEFSFPGLYQVMRGEDKFKDFLPSKWQQITLSLDGYDSKTGIIEHQPNSLLVFETENGVNFYDPDRVRLVGWANFDLQGPTLKVDRLYFLVEDELKSVSLADTDKIVKPVFNWLYEIGEYRLSDNGQLIVYQENKEFRYKSKSCGEGSVLVDGYRLELKEMLVDLLNDETLVVSGKVFDGGDKVYQVVCREGDMVAREVLTGSVSSLVYLDKKTIFYSDAGGSYFYDLEKNTKVKYTALGSNVKTIISADKKYIGAIVNGKLMVVDYPGVQVSGVEKHYLIDLVNNLDGVRFVGDEILVNESKTCESDGDCGEVLRISLMGSGVWSVKDRVQLKDVKVEKILGEIKF